MVFGSLALCQCIKKDLVLQFRKQGASIRALEAKVASIFKSNLIAHAQRTQQHKKKLKI